MASKLNDLNMTYPTPVRSKGSSAIRTHITPIYLQHYSGEKRTLFSGKLYVDLDHCLNNHIITKSSKSILSLSSSKTKNKRKSRHCDLLKLTDERGSHSFYLVVFKIKNNEKLIVFFQLELFENIKISSNSINKFVVFDCEESFIVFTSDSELQRNNWLDTINQRSLIEISATVDTYSPGKAIEIDIDLSDEDESTEPAHSKSTQQAHSPNHTNNSGDCKMTIDSLSFTPRSNRKNPLPSLGVVNEPIRLEKKRNNSNSFNISGPNSVNKISRSPIITTSDSNSSNRESPLEKEKVPTIPTTVTLIDNVEDKQKVSFLLRDGNMLTSSESELIREIKSLIIINDQLNEAVEQGEDIRISEQQQYIDSINKIQSDLDDSLACNRLLDKKLMDEREVVESLNRQLLFFEDRNKKQEVDGEDLLKAQEHTILSLQETIIAKDLIVSQSEDRKEELMRLNDSLTSQLFSANSKIESLQGEINRLNSIHSQEMDFSSKERDFISSHVRAEVELMSNQLLSLQDELSKCKLELLEATRTNESIENQFKLSANKCELLQIELEKVNVFQERDYDNSSRMKMLEKELQQLKIENINIKGSEESLKYNNKILENLLSEQKLYENEMNKQLEAAASLKKQYYEVTNQANTYSNTIDNIKNENVRLTNELSNAKEQLNNYETDKVHLNLEYNTQTNVLRNELESVKNKVKQLTAELSHKSTELSVIQRRLEMSKDQVLQLENDLLEVNRIHTTEQQNYLKQNSNLNEALEANNKTIRSLQDKIKDLDNDHYRKIEDLIRESNQKDDLNTILKSTNFDLSSKYNLLDEQLKKLNQQYNNEKDNFKNLKDQFVELQSEKSLSDKLNYDNTNDLVKELDSTKTLLKEFKMKINEYEIKLSREADRSGQSVKELSQLLSSTEKSNKQLREDLATLHSEYQKERKSVEDRISDLINLHERSESRVFELEKVLSSKDIEYNITVNKQSSIEMERLASLKKLNKRIQVLDEELVNERREMSEMKSQLQEKQVESDNRSLEIEYLTVENSRLRESVKSITELSSEKESFFNKMLSEQYNKSDLLSKDNAIMTNKITKLESLNNSLHLSLSERDDEISSLKVEVVEFKKLVEESTESINVSAKYIGELKSEVNNLYNNIGEKEQIILSLDGEVSTRNSEVHRLHSEIKICRDLESQIRVELANLKQLLLERESELESSKISILEFSETINEKKSSWDILHVELVEMKSSFESLMTEKEKLIAELALNEQQISKNIEDINIYNDKISNLLKELNVSKQESLAISSQNACHKEEVNTLVEDKKNLQGEISKLENMLQDRDSSIIHLNDAERLLSDRVEQLELEIRDIKISGEKIIKDVTDHYNEAFAKLQTVSEDNNVLTSNMNRFLEFVLTLPISNISPDITNTFESKMINLKFFIDSLMIDNDKVNREMEDLISIIEQKDLLVDNLNSKVKSLDEQIVSLGESMNLIESKLLLEKKQFEIEIEKYKNEINVKREEAVIMVSECEERITRLLQNLSDNNDKLSCKTETIAECENKIAKLIQTISDKNEIINDKTAELIAQDKLQKRLSDNLKSEINSLNDKLVEFNKKNDVLKKENTNFKSTITSQMERNKQYDELEDKFQCSELRAAKESRHRMNLERLLRKSQQVHESRVETVIDGSKCYSQDSSSNNNNQFFTPKQSMIQVAESKQGSVNRIDRYILSKSISKI